METKIKEQLNSITHLNEEIDKVKALVAKEMKAVDQLNDQSDRLNDEIRNVANLISFEEAKLAKGQVDE